MDWFLENFSTIAVAGILLLLVGLVIRKMIRDKKSGKSSCGNCSACNFSQNCHNRK